jgi:hypothetical protein
MLPDWDFNGDEAKLRAFVAWVEAELDRFAMLASARYSRAGNRGDWAAVLSASKPVPRAVGCPRKPFRGRNAMIWEFGLLRYMFRRYWPDRKRRIADPASAASIAVARCFRALPGDQRTSDRVNVRRARMADEARKVFDEWEKGDKSPGRQEADLDAAFLDTLPDHLFAR